VDDAETAWDCAGRARFFALAASCTLQRNPHPAHPLIHSRPFPRPFPSHSTLDDAFTPELKKAIDSFIAENKIVLFIKGTKDFPSCGFSQTVVNIFRTMDVPFETVNILEDDRLRTGMKAYSQWPTFPQVYLNGAWDAQRVLFFGWRPSARLDREVCAFFFPFASHPLLSPPSEQTGEFFGGCDILIDAYTSGALVEEVERAMAE